jgi:branched-chain amino acid transport system substrate-binding protein
MKQTEPEDHRGHTRRAVLRGSAAALLGGAVAPALLPGRGYAAESYPALGTYPAGVSGTTAFIGIGADLTGPYAAQGADQQKGYELAIAHINEGNPLPKMMSPLIKTGVLGKQLTFGVVDTESKPNTAIQAHTRFINTNKAMMITGSVSSAVAVALNKLAQREKVIYLPAISGSNDTTGKDCTRYSFRACDDAYMAAAAIAPVLIRELGRDKKVAYLTPDYTYGHSVHQSMAEFTKPGGWTEVTNQLPPLGAPDFSSYLLNIANSGADVLVNIGFGADAVNSIKQAKQFGILEKMQLVLPYNAPFTAQEVGADIMQGVYATTEFWWTHAEKNPIAKAFVDAFDAKYHYKPEWGAHIAYLQMVLWADSVEQAGTFYPPEVIKAYEKGTKRQTTVGEVYWRAEDHQLVRPVFVQRGKKPADMRNPEDYFDTLEVVPGSKILQPLDTTGCKLGEVT